MPKTVEWDTKFKTQFTLRLNEGVFSSTHDQVKRLLKDQFDDLQKEYPGFKPKIRFNDTEKTIDVGYAYSDFYYMLNHDHPLLKTFPHPHGIPKPENPYISYSVLHSPRSMYEQGLFNKKVIFYNLKDPLFSEAVQKSQDQTLFQPRKHESKFIPPASTENIVQEYISTYKENRSQDKHNDNHKKARLIISQKSTDSLGTKMVIKAIQSGSVKNLCVEHFYSDVHQVSLDQWMKEPHGAPMPPDLEAHVKYLDDLLNSKKTPNWVGYRMLLEAAKAQNVPVIALETEATHQARYSNDADLNRAQHAQNFNYVAAEIIKHKVDDKSFVALVSYLHSSNAMVDGQKIVGLDRLTHAQSLSIEIRTDTISSAFLTPSEDVLFDKAYCGGSKTKDNKVKIHEIIRPDILVLHKSTHLSHDPEYKTRVIKSENFYSGHYFESINPHQNSDRNKTEVVQWDTNFKTKFNLEVRSWGEPQLSYEDLKEGLIHDFQKLQKLHPDFIPKIRFIDSQKIIEVGHSYPEFYEMLSRESSILPLMPPVTCGPYTNNHLTYDVQALPSIEYEKVLKKNSHIISYDFGHLSFNEAVDKSQNDIFDQRSREDEFLTSSQEKIISDWIDFQNKNNKPARLFVGENHHNDMARKLIIAAIKSGSVKNLCVEHFYYETHQDSLDEWIKDAPQGAPMPPNLEGHVEYLDRGFGFLSGPNWVGYKELLQEAKASGVRVIALDTEATHQGPQHHRIPNFNYVAHNIIKHEMTSADSFVALVGSSHSSDLIKNEKTILGLDRLCKAKSLAVVKTSDSSRSKVFFNKDCIISDGKSKIIRPDILILDEPTASSRPNTSVKIVLKDRFDSQQFASNQASAHNINSIIHETNVPSNAPTAERYIPDPLETLKTKESAPSQQHSVLISQNTLETPIVETHQTVKGSPIRDFRTGSAPGQDMLTLNRQSSSTTSNQEKHGAPPQTLRGGKTVGRVLDILDIAANTHALKNSPHPATALGATATFGELGARGTLKAHNVIKTVVESDVPSKVAHALTKHVHGFDTILRAAPLATKNALKMFTPAAKVAQHFLKAVPGLNIALSSYSMGESSLGFANAIENGHATEAFKHGLNIALDMLILGAIFVPGVGPFAVLGLIAARLSTDIITVVEAQLKDATHFEKNCDILVDPNASWGTRFTSGLKAVVQAIPYVFQKNKLEEQRVLEANNLTKAEFKDFVTSTSLEEGTHILDCLAGKFSPQAGALVMTIGEDKVTLETNSKSYTPLDFGKKPLKTLILKMGYGGTHEYKFEKVKEKTTFREAKLIIDSLKATYDARQTTADIVFITPSPDLFTGNKTPLPVLKWSTSQYHYDIIGGKGNNTFMLGKQNTTLVLGPGHNMIHAPFENTGDERTIILKGYRDDGLCTLHLNDVTVDSDLFKKAKIHVDNESQTLKIVIGKTTIHVHAHAELLEKGHSHVDVKPLKKLLLNLDDGALVLEMPEQSDLLTTHDQNTPHIYDLEALITSSDMGYNNIFKKALSSMISSRQELTPEYLLMIAQKLAEDPSGFVGIKGENFKPEAMKLLKHCLDEVQDLKKQKSGVYQVSAERYEELQKESVRKTQKKFWSFIAEHFQPNETLHGTGGIDRFTVNPDECGQVVIKGFEDSKDKIRIVFIKKPHEKPYDVKTLMDSVIEDKTHNNSSVIHFGAGSLMLEGIRKEQITEDDFSVEDVHSILARDLGLQTSHESDISM